MPVDQSQLSQNTYCIVGNGQYAQSQSFTPTKGEIIGVMINKYSATSGTPNDLVIAIRTNNAGVPSATVLTSKTYTYAQWNAFSNGMVFVPFTPVALTPATVYHIVMTAGNTGGIYFLGNYNSSVYAGGNRCQSITAGSSWSAQTDDLAFQTLYAPNSQIIITG
jgi:hypothetical protein